MHLNVSNIHDKLFIPFWTNSIRSDKFGSNISIFSSFFIWFCKIDKSFFISSFVGFLKYNELNRMSCWKHIDSINISVNSSKCTLFACNDFSFKSSSNFKQLFQKIVEGEGILISPILFSSSSFNEDNNSTFSMAFSRREIIWSNCSGGVSLLMVSDCKIFWIEKFWLSLLSFLFSDIYVFFSLYDIIINKIFNLF